MSFQKQIPDEDRAMQYALLLLGYRQRSEAEMRGRLGRKAYAPAVIERTLTELTRLGLLDDRDFVECWIASRTGRGPALLKQELRQKGIERSLAEEIIRTGISAEDECDAAWQVATRALLHQTLPLERAAFLRIRRLLQRRGFSFDVISRVCARLSEHQHADGDWLE